MRVLFLLATLALAGCVTRNIGNVDTEPGPVATLRGTLADPISYLVTGEAHCNVFSVDDSKMGSFYRLRPGKHTVLVTLIHISDRYTGHIELTLPEAKDYLLHAHLKADTFHITLTENGSSKVIAADDEPVNGHIEIFFMLPVPK